MGREEKVVREEKGGRKRGGGEAGGRKRWRGVGRYNIYTLNKEVENDVCKRVMYVGADRLGWSLGELLH